MNGFERGIVSKLYESFEEFNALHFGGRLLVPFIVTEDRSLLHYLGSCRKKFDLVGCGFEIFIDAALILENSLDDKFLFARNTLLHEMIHLDGMAAHGANEMGRFSHGFWFASQCNRIGAYYGWPRVRSHNRKHKKRRCIPDCQHWPNNVRDAEYQRFFRNLHRQVRDKLLEQKPAPVAPDDTYQIKSKGIAGLKAVESFIMDSIPDIETIRALKDVRQLVKLSVPAFEWECLK